MIFQLSAKTEQNFSMDQEKNIFLPLEIVSIL